MSLSRDDVIKIAALARLELNEQEIGLYQEQLSGILAYVERLGNLDLDDVPQSSSADVLVNVLRNDVVEPSLEAEDALFNAPRHTDNQFEVQAVLNEE